MPDKINLEPWLVLGALKRILSPEVWAEHMSARALISKLGLKYEPNSKHDGWAHNISEGRRPSDSDVVMALQTREVQQTIADDLGVPASVFQARNGMVVAAMVAEKKDLLRQGLLDPDGYRDWVTVPRSLSDYEVVLDKVEQTEVDKLASKITAASKHNIQYWHAPEPVGSGLLAYAVAAKLNRDPSMSPEADPKRGVWQTFVVRPFPNFTECYLQGDEDDLDGRQAFDEGIRCVAEQVGLDPNMPDLSEQLLNTLLQTRAVLFVLNVDLLKGAVHDCYLARLLKGVMTLEAREEGTPAPICLVGRLPTPQDLPSSIQRLADHLIKTDVQKEMETTANATYDSIRAKHGEEGVRQEKSNIRMKFFRSEWQRYREQRFLKLDREPGSILADDWQGPRIRTAEWYYDTLDEALVWPHSIRLRAFLASNYDTASYWDPTQGWTRLAGMPVKRLPHEIQLILDEVVAHLWHTRIKSDVRTLCWISTSLYWLTAKMLKELAGALYPRGGEKKFKSSVDSLKTVVRASDSTDSRYRSGITVKSIIQERWRVKERLVRQQAHFMVAKCLWNDRHSQNVLTQEFPLAPHWGQESLIFMAETVRHLMRACEGNLGEKPNQLEEFPDKFLDLAKKDTFSVYDAVNFCFGSVYWVGINGNHKEFGSGHRRRLGKQHGLYYLAAELLELMSAEATDGSGRKLGTPHRALHPKHVLRYYREVAFALMDIGELDGAQQAVERLLEVADTSEYADIIFQLNAMLDLVIILSTRDRLEEANAILAKVKEGFRSLPDPNAPPCAPDLHPATTLVSDPKSPDARRWRHRYERLEHRIKVREAHLLYLGRRFNAVLDIYAEMHGKKEQILSQDLAHPYIGALGALGDGYRSGNADWDSADEFDYDKATFKAFELAMKAAHHCYMEQQHHEQIGYKIAAAHAWRKLGHPNFAEIELDLVLHTILTEGCSERTYLAFLLEAGRILIAQKRYARAYWVYLRPCLNRAESRDFLRIARTSLNYCRVALGGLPSEINDCTLVGDDSHKLRHRVMNGEASIFKKHATRYEPKYTFGLHQADGWSTVTSIDVALQEHRSQLSEIAERLEARAKRPMAVPAVPSGSTPTGTPGPHHLDVSNAGAAAQI